MFYIYIIVVKVKILLNSLVRKNKLKDSIGFVKFCLAVFWKILRKVIVQFIHNFAVS